MEALSLKSDIRKEQAVTLLRREMTLEALWNALEQFEGTTFTTAKGLPFTYTLLGGELFVSRKEKSITRATIELAFQRALALGPAATGPKKLGVFGASYLYPVFRQLGVIPPSPGETYEEMGFTR